MSTFIITFFLEDPNQITEGIIYRGEVPHPCVESSATCSAGSFYERELDNVCRFPALAAPRFLLSFPFQFLRAPVYCRCRSVYC